MTKRHRLILSRRCLDGGDCPFLPLALSAHFCLPALRLNCRGDAAAKYSAVLGQDPGPARPGLALSHPFSSLPFPAADEFSWTRTNVQSRRSAAAAAAGRSAWAEILLLWVVGLGWSSSPTSLGFCTLPTWMAPLYQASVHVAA